MLTFHHKVIRLLLAAILAVMLMAAPAAPPTYAGDCSTSGSHNCGG